MENNEWFISSENSLNKFKHGLKSIFLFIILPIIFTHFLISFFSIPTLYPEKYSVIKQNLNLVFGNGFEGFFSNAKVFALTSILYLKLNAKIFLYLAPMYVFFAVFFYKKVKNKTQELMQRKYISGSKLADTYSIMRGYLIKERGFNKLDFLTLWFVKKFVSKRKSISILKSYLYPLFEFEIADIPLLRKYEIAHVLIPGASRKGKSQILRDPIFKAKELSKNKKAKGIITDEKGEWFSKTGNIENGDLIFNPLDSRSLKWNIFNDIENIIDIENFSKWVIPDSNKDPFWTNSARDILKNCLVYLWNENLKTNSDLKSLINSGQEKIYNLLYEKLSPGAAEFLEKRDSYLSFKVYMNFVDYLEDGDFSIKQWLQREQGFIYLTSNIKTKAIFKPVMTLFVNVLGAEILSMSDNYNEDKRIYLFLEEFTSLDRLDMIIQILKLSGSKGVSVWLAFQDFQQITKIYTKDDMSSIINNCSSIACLGLNEPESAEYFSKRLGEQKFKEKTISHSMGIKDNRDGLSLNEQVKSERVVSSSELLNLPALHAYIKLDGTAGICKVDFQIHNDPIINEHFVLNKAISTPLKDITQQNKDNSSSSNFDFNDDDFKQLEDALIIEKSKSKDIDSKNELLEGL